MACLSFIGLALNYVLRVTINLTIVAMIKPHNSSSASSDHVLNECGFDSDDDDVQDFVSYSDYLKAFKEEWVNSETH